MTSNEQATDRPKTCIVEGCQEPKKSYPSGLTIRFCAAHESARVQIVKRRLVTDPETGETMTANRLAQRQHYARRARLAAKGES